MTQFNNFESQINHIFDAITWLAIQAQDEELIQVFQHIREYPTIKAQAKEFYYLSHNKEALFDWWHEQIPKSLWCRFPKKSQQFVALYLGGIFRYADTVIDAMLHWSHHPFNEVSDRARKDFTQYYLTVQATSDTSAAVWLQENLMSLISNNFLINFLEDLAVGNVPTEK